MRKITFLTTAIVLLAFLAFPLGMWGQSDYSTDYMGNITLSTTGGTSASTCKVVIDNTQYDGIKAGTGSITGAMRITVPANTKHLHIHVAAWKNTTASLAVTPTGYSGDIALTANSGISNNSPFTFSGDPSTSDYYKVITFADALDTDTDLTFTAVGGTRFVIWGVTSEEEGVGPTVATPTFDPANGTTFGNEGLSVTISCATAGASIYYTLDGSTPDDESTLYSSPISLTTTTTIKAIAYDANDNTSNVATATYTYVDPTAPGTINNPYTIAQARAAIDAGTGVTGVYATGIVSQIVTPYSSQYSNITFNMVDEEGDEDFLQAFRCTGDLASEVTVGDVAIVYGNLIYYQNTGIYEFSSGCQLITLTHTGAFVEMPTFSPEGGTYTEAQTVSITCATEGTSIYYTIDGSDPDDESTLYSTPITVSETTTIKAIAYDSQDNSSAIATATYTIQVPVPMQTFSKTEGHYPVEGQTYLIVDLNSGRALTSANGSSGAPTAVEVTITDDQITTDNAELMWTFEAVEGGYIVNPFGDDAKWLYTTDANNGVRVGTNENKIWTLNVTDETNTDYLGFKNNATSRYLGVYNNQDWRTYTSVNNNIKDTQIALFVNGEAPVVPSITIENNDEIAYNATSGSFDFTVNNPVDGGQLSVSEDVDWISNAAVSENSVTFTTTVNETGTPRHGVITLTYTYNRAAVTKDVTITQAGNPDATMTIAEVREQGTGDVATIGTVTSFSVNNSNKTTAYIQDATAAIVVFGEFTVAVGDEIRVSGTLSTYHGLLEITNPVVTVLSSGNTVNPEVMTIAEINADDYTSNNSIQGLYVTIENAKVTGISGSNTTIAQGDNTIVVRGISSDVTYAVNDTLTLNGNIGCFDGAQIAHPTDVIVQSNQEPAITVTPTRVDVPCAAAEGTLTVTYQNIETELGAEIYWYEADGETPATYDWVSANFDTVNNVAYTISANTGEARLAYMKVYGIGTDESDVYSELITFSQGHYIPDFATLPFEFDGGRADIAGTNGLTQEGLGSDYNNSPKLKFDGTGDWMILHFNEEPGQLTYCIKGNTFSNGTFTVQTSADGETYTDLAVYTELGAIDTVEFDLDANVRYIKWIYTEKGNGNVALGNIKVTLPSTAPVITVTPALVELDADATDDVLEVTYQNITTILAEVYFCDAEGQPAQYDWIMAEIDEDNNVYYVIDANEGTARTAYLKVYAPDDNDQVVYSNLVTISQAEYVIPMPEQQFALFGGDLVEGDYIIYYNGKAMNNVISSGRLQYAEIEPENDVITTDNAAIVWHIAPNDEGYWTIYSADANAYAASTGVKNKAQLLEDGTDDMAMWSVSEISDTYYEFVNKANEEDSINANLRNNGTYGFACYSANTGGALSLYKYTETVATYTLEIAGYGNSEGRYYLIASPVLAVTPTVDNGFLMEEPVQYDLYCFDQTFSGEEWRNYKVEPFNLTSGKGYLFASQGNTTLTFTGIPYNGDNDGAVALDYFGDDSSWNLIGNPYHSDAGLYVRFGNEYVYEEADYYVMNAEGTDFELADRVIHPKEGIFIQATAANEIACFCDGSWWPSNFLEGGEMLNVRVSDENGKGDIVRIRFGEGRTLNKFMLNENNTKLYFVLGDEELAVVRCGAESEMPLNFKPEANGTYTLSIDAEHVEMQYLHLIDNLTGEDIDLLANPSYKFEASVYDNAARFTLVVRK